MTFFELLWGQLRRVTYNDAAKPLLRIIDPVGVKEIPLRQCIATYDPGQSQIIIHHNAETVLLLLGGWNSMHSNPSDKRFQFRKEAVIYEVLP